MEPLYQLDGGDYVIYLGTFSKILSPGIRLGWLCAPPPVMEKIVLGKQATDLCTSTLTQYFVAEYFERGPLARVRREPHRGLPRAPRRDARGARASLPAAGEWTAPRAGSSCGRRCPTTSTRPTCSRKALRENVAFVPGAGRLRRRARDRARCGSTSRARRGRDPRGNRPDRRGRVASRSSSTRRSPASTGRRRAPAPEPRRRTGGGGRRAAAAPARGDGEADEGRGARRAGARWSAGVAALGRAGRGRAGALGHEVVRDRRRRAIWSRRLKEERPEVAFIALHGPGGEDGTARSCSRSSASPTPAPASPRACAAWTRSLAKHELRAAGIPTPDWVAFNATAFRELGAADALEEIEARLGFPLVVKPAARGRRSGVRFAAARDDVPEALVAAFSYDDRVLLERHVDGRELAVGILDGEALPVVEIAPEARRTASTTRPATRSGAPISSARPS